MTIEETIEATVRRVLREELRALKEDLGSSEPLVSYEQAAKYASCSKATIQGLVNSGALPATGKPGSHLRRVLLSDVKKALGAQTSAPKPVTAARSRADEILKDLGARKLKAVR